jgi:L-lactate permease
VKVYAGWRSRLSAVKRIPAWLTYTILRLVFLIVPFFILWALGFQPWIAAIIAALIALSLSIIFLSKFRNATSEEIFEARSSRAKKPAKAGSDESVEDAL